MFPAVGYQRKFTPQVPLAEKLASYLESEQLT
jgi:hypothetical protein